MAKRAAINDVRPVLDVLDKELDAVEETLDKIEQSIDHGVEAVEHVVETGVHAATTGGHKAVHFLRSPRMAGLVILTCGVAGAGFVGWKLAQRHYSKKFEQDLTREVEAAHNFYSRMNKAGAFATPEEAAKTLHVVTPEEDAHILKAEEATEALKTYQGKKTDYNRVEKATEALNTVVPETVKSNVFVNGKPLNPEEFDYDTELKSRTEDAPFVISFDEFAQNESELPQTTFTYYQGDDVLTDEKDDIILDVEGTVGSDNLLRFGAGSDDPNTVYIRNPKTGIEFEVTRSEGKFGEEVGGFQGSGNVARRFKPGDDG